MNTAVDPHGSKGAIVSVSLNDLCLPSVIFLLRSRDINPSDALVWIVKVCDTVRSNPDLCVGDYVVEVIPDLYLTEGRIVTGIKVAVERLLSILRFIEGELTYISTRNGMVFIGVSICE